MHAKLTQKEIQYIKAGLALCIASATDNLKSARTLTGNQSSIDTIAECTRLLERLKLADGITMHGLNAPELQPDKIRSETGASPTVQSVRERMLRFIQRMTA